MPRSSRGREAKPAKSPQKPPLLRPNMEPKMGLIPLKGPIWGLKLGRVYPTPKPQTLIRKILLNRCPMLGILLGRSFGMCKSSLTGNMFHRPPKAKQDYPPSAKTSICKIRERVYQVPCLLGGDHVLRGYGVS